MRVPWADAHALVRAEVKGSFLKREAASHFYANFTISRGLIWFFLKNLRILMSFAGGILADQNHRYHAGASACGLGRRYFQPRSWSLLE